MTKCVAPPFEFGSAFRLHIHVVFMLFRLLADQFSYSIAIELSSLVLQLAFIVYSDLTSYISTMRFASDSRILATRSANLGISSVVLIAGILFIRK